MSRKLKLREAAKTDVLQAFNWYEDRERGLGFEFTRAVRVAFAAIERDPTLYPVALEDIQRAQIGRFPYIVYFVVLPNAVSVIAVLHARRDPRVWHDRSD